MNIANILVIILLITGFLYYQGQPIVVSGVQAVVGKIGDTIDPANPIIWNTMKDVKGEVLTCSSNQQCADYLTVFESMDSGLANANSRCYKLKCQYAET